MAFVEQELQNSIMTASSQRYHTASTN